eukprot:7376432-Prymnesium_polylepis.1
MAATVATVAAVTAVAAVAIAVVWSLLWRRQRRWEQRRRSQRCVVGHRHPNFLPASHVDGVVHHLVPDAREEAGGDVGRNEANDRREAVGAQAEERGAGREAHDCGGAAKARAVRVMWRASSRTRPCRIACAARQNPRMRGLP